MNSPGLLSGILPEPPTGGGTAVGSQLVSRFLAILSLRLSGSLAAHVEGRWRCHLVDAGADVSESPSIWAGTAGRFGVHF